MQDMLNTGFVVSLYKKLSAKLDSRFRQVTENTEELERQVFSALDEIETLQGPRGLDGAVGPMGPQGLAGAKGEKGERGEKGDPGERGETGEKGDKGDQGETGATGATGAQGPQGLRGADGESGVAGTPGAKGDKGDTGDTGSRGERGERGETGERGLPGPAGEPGRQGEKGERGDPGEKGEKGDTGADGKDADTQEVRDYITTLVENTRKNLESSFESTDSKVDDIDKYVREFETKFRKEVEGNIETFKKFVNTQLSSQMGGSTSGGGSVNILQMDDVEFKKRHQVEGDAILIFDETKKKFVSESFNDIIERLQVGMEQQYDRLVDTDGDYIYIGEATPGTERTAASWRIKRVYEIGDDIEIIWADNTAGFSKVWNDRTTYEYS